jgi:predicted DNA-binding protein with PD1-like motif
MKKRLFFAFAAVTLALAVYAGPARENKTTADSKAKREAAMKDSAPEVLTVSGGFQRMVVVRLKRGTDLLDGLKQAVAREGIRNAAILSGIGSLTSYHVHAVSNTTLPARNVFYRADGPQDLLNVNGYVIDGRIHAHIVFSDDRKGLGGHLEPGTTVFTFAIITLGVLEDGTSLARFDDPGW